jgi:hypothetical protein
MRHLHTDQLHVSMRSNASSAPVLEDTAFNEYAAGTYVSGTVAAGTAAALDAPPHAMMGAGDVLRGGARTRQHPATLHKGAVVSAASALDLSSALGDYEGAMSMVTVDYINMAVTLALQHHGCAGLARAWAPRAITVQPSIAPSVNHGVLDFTSGTPRALYDGTWIRIYIDGVGWVCIILIFIIVFIAVDIDGIDIAVIGVVVAVVAVGLIVAPLVARVAEDCDDGGLHGGIVMCAAHPFSRADPSEEGTHQTSRVKVPSDGRRYVGKGACVDGV